MKRSSTVVLLGVAAIFGCIDTRNALVAPPDLDVAAAKSGSVSVTATDPSYGDQGQVNESVTIIGSGFSPGSQAAWLRNGVVDTTIVVSSTQYVSSTRLVAVISISPKSPADYRDVMVTTAGRTQGIGSMVFEVTQATIIPGTSWARGVNDNGELTGTLTTDGAFYFNSATGFLQTVSTSGTGYDISPLGNAIVGEGGAGYPYLYTRAGAVGSAWQATALPLGATSTGGSARAMLTDHSTGQVTLIGGMEYLPKSKGGGSPTLAILWSWQASTGTWQRIVLPSSGTSIAHIRHRGLSENGTAVGGEDGATAAVWMPGPSGYSEVLLNGQAANGISSDASIIVGFDKPSTGSRAVYWTPSGSGWGTAIVFNGGCAVAKDVAWPIGRVLLQGCPFNNVSFQGFIDPPYATSSPQKLGGLGPRNNLAVASGISPSGGYVAGQGTQSMKNVGVYWRLF